MKHLSTIKTADLREELAVALGRAKEAEALLERGRADLDRLEEGQRRAQTALDAKNQEVKTDDLVKRDGLPPCIIAYDKNTSRTTRGRQRVGGSARCRGGGGGIFGRFFGVILVVSGDI